MMKNNLVSFRRKTIRLGLIISCSFALMFGLTINQQAVHYADASDLLLASIFGGLAHPPGYPLYVWLLHALITTFPHLSPVLLSGWFNAICMGITAGLLVMIIVGLGYRIFKVQLHLGLVTLLLLLWGLIPLNWTLATVAEVMPLSLVLLLLLIVACLEPLKVNGKLPRKVFSSGFWGMMAGLYHPLVLGGVVWIWLFWIIRWRSSWRKWVLTWVRGLTAGFVITGLLYKVLVNNWSWYSWSVPSTFWEWWDFWSRQVYTSSGSAIETLSNDWNIWRTLDGILRWIRWWNLDQQGWILTILALSGFVILFIEKKREYLYLLLIPLLLYSLGVAAYLKHPESYVMSETGKWWGIALRERMFYLLPLTMLLPATVVTIILSRLCGIAAKLVNLGTILGLAVCIGMLWVNFNQRIMPSDNAAQIYIKKLLDSLPQNATLLVDNDDVFGILFTQSVLNIRRDVITVPIGMILTPSWWNTYSNQLSKHGFSTNKPEFIKDLVNTALLSNRRIFLYGVDSYALEQIGIEGNPYYARPNGYTLEILSSRYTTIPASDYGLSVQLAAIKTTDVDNWFKGFRAHLGTIHAQQAYFLSRIGLTDEAEWQAAMAKDLFYLDDSRQTVSSILREGISRYKLYGSYIGQ